MYVTKTITLCLLKKGVCLREVKNAAFAAAAVIKDRFKRGVCRSEVLNVVSECGCSCY